MNKQFSDIISTSFVLTEWITILYISIITIDEIWYFACRETVIIRCIIYFFHQLFNTEILTFLCIYKMGAKYNNDLTCNRIGQIWSVMECSYLIKIHKFINILCVLHAKMIFCKINSFWCMLKWLVRKAFYLSLSENFWNH